MFASIERKLAILNVSVVIVLVALIGLGTWVLLRQSLDREADNALEDRISAARDALGDPPAMTVPTSTAPAGTLSSDDRPDGDDDDDEDNDDGEDDDEHEKESREILTSGDTLLFTFDDSGTQITNPRDVEFEGIPDRQSVAAALSGQTDTRVITIDGERMRIRTEPVQHEDEVVGAIQAVRSEAEHDEELALVRNITLIGSGIGILVAVPAGIYLTRRAMAPINDAMRRQRAFVADASHELRTPLTVLRANAEMLARTPDISREEFDEELHAIIGEVDGMSHLVNELLELSRIDSRARSVTVEPVMLRPVIARVVAMLAPQARDAGVTLSAVETELSVLANVSMIEQVLRILLDNAIRYTPGGGLVEISTTHVGDQAVIEVRDSGIGIRPEDLPRVYDRFFRGENARGHATGTGLGLSIAREIVTLLKGTISIQSIPGSGTVVRVLLPDSSAPSPKSPTWS